MPKTELELMLSGHGLMTAQIYYRMPDFESLLQSFAWQEYDVAPDFPRLIQFLDFWDRTLDGAIHSVQFSHRRLIAPGDWKTTDGEFLIN
jgi:uncharacterized protein Usg